MRNFTSLAAVLVASSFLAACTSTPIAEAPKAATPVAAAPTPAPKPVAAVTAPVAPKAVAPYLDPQSPIFRERSVYFEFDKFVLMPEGQRLMELHGKFLASNPGVTIRIEGNADEQGGKEYNLALGQKRADAVVKALSVFGVKASQMEAVSFGEEKPKATGRDEASYAQNRRADLAYPTK